MLLDFMRKDKHIRIIHYHGSYLCLIHSLQFIIIIHYHTIYNINVIQLSEN